MTNLKINQYLKLSIREMENRLAIEEAINKLAKSTNQEYIIADTTNEINKLKTNIRLCKALLTVNIERGEE